MATVVDERALDERLAQLEAARAWSPRVVSRLETLIREGDDAALFRVNPFTFAAERGLDPGEAIDLLLHATSLGLFEMDWLLICPRCACAVESFARLRAVLQPVPLPRCHNDYEAAMDDFIAIYFTVSPQICAIRYHRPETLEPFDYMFHFRAVREGRRPDGVPYIDAMPSGAARRSAFWSPGLLPASRSRPHRARSTASAPTPTPASSCTVNGEPRGRAAARPPGLARRRLRAR